MSNPTQTNYSYTRALAYFITFSTYGARLHGDDAGSVDHQHRVYGTPFYRANGAREKSERERMVGEPYVLEAHRRAIVLKSCRHVCEFRGWALKVAHVRSNHVHVVVKADAEPEKVMNSFKAYASRALNEGGCDSKERRRSSRHGSTKYLWTEKQVSDASSVCSSGTG